MPALPRIWKVLHDRNGNFTGRKDLLSKLRIALTSGQVGARVQAIIGMGGVGKTQIAVEYAYEYAGNYALVWWVRAEEPATLASDLAGLATEIGLGNLGLVETGTVEQPAVVTAVRRWLERTPGWLLVFDNAKGSDELRNYLPQGEMGHVLVTSRNPVWGVTAHPFQVRELPRDDAVTFLLRRTRQGDADAARDLATELGELPLALEQAGAYMEETGRPLPEYLQLLRDRREVLKRAKPSTDYSETVATTWELSFRELRAVCSPAADLLNFCAFLAPEDIPRELLTNGGRYLPPDLGETVADPLRWDEAMKAVRRYSLLELTRDALRVHRLVQAVARDRLEPRASRDWTEVVVQLMDGAFPEDAQDVGSWPRAARLVPHALAAADHGERLKVQVDVVARLLIRVGLYLRTRAHFTEAQAALERALAIAKTVYQPDNPEVATVVNELGRILHDLGQHPQAQAAFEQALRVHEAAYGPNDPLVARDLNDLGSILLSRGELKKAIANLQRAVRIDEAAHGPDHADVARDAGNLGRALHAAGNLRSAREWLERALTIDEAHHGSNHPSVASDLSNLGLALQEIGDTSRARACYQRSLHIREQVLGTDHPSTVRVRHRLDAISAAD